MLRLTLFVSTGLYPATVTFNPPNPGWKSDSFLGGDVSEMHEESETSIYSLLQRRTDLWKPESFQRPWHPLMVTPVTHDNLICEIATRTLYFLWVIYKRPQPVQGEAPCKIYCNEVKPEGSPDVTLWIPWHLEGDISIVEAPKKAMFFGSFLERDFKKNVTPS